MRTCLLLAAGIAGVTLLGAAQQPSALAGSAPGRWEIEGVPGPKAECVSELLTLARFEHRAAKACTTKVLSDTGSSVLVEYRCAPGEFGRSKIDVVTPRSLRIETQGISGGLPFAYVLQARRSGECAEKSASARH